LAPQLLPVMKRIGCRQTLVITGFATSGYTHQPKVISTGRGQCTISRKLNEK